MNNLSYRCIFLILFPLILSGCFGRTQLPYSVFKHPVPLSADFESLEEINKVIKVSAINRGWVVNEKSLGLLELTFRKKTHVVMIAVSFNKSNYSIKYLDSTNLLYDGKSIHRNYNRWVANLERDIELNLQKAALERS